MKTPGGVHSKSFDGLNSGIDKSGFERTVRKPSRYGEIYIAEKYDDGVWYVIWVARNLARTLECNRWSSRTARTDAAYSDALLQLREREKVYKEL